jgi:transposase
MRQKSKSTLLSSGVVRDIRRATRKHRAAEKKIRIVLDRLRGETSIAELCRREGIAESMYYSCRASKSLITQSPHRDRIGSPG